MTTSDAAARVALGRTQRWWLGGWSIAVVVTCAACGSSHDEQILPGPSTSSSGSGGSGGSGASAGSGPSGAACPVYAPDRCPDAAGSQACVALDGDPANCGSCGVTCEPQAACVAGKCGSAPQELAHAAACGDVRLALHGSSLIWTERTSGRVRALSLDSGVDRELASGRLAPNRIAVDDDAVYWIDGGDGSSGSSKVMRAALPLSEAPTALVTAPGKEPFVGVAVDGGKLFYGLGHDIHAITADGSDSADVIVGVAFARNDTRVPDGAPEALTVHDGRVYWIVTTVGSVESDDLLEGADGTPRVGHSGSMWPNDLGFAGDYVYYAAFASLYAAQTELPAVAVASSADDSSVTAFAVNAADAYFADQGGRLSKHGVALPAGPDFQATPSVLLARDQGNITAVVLDETNVYWASVDPTSGDCAIRKLPL